MSRNILDLIDNAIWDATGPDAMRWMPDAEHAAEEPCRCLLCIPQSLVDGYVAALDALVLGPEVGPASIAPDADLAAAQAWIREQAGRSYIRGPLGPGGYTPPPAALTALAIADIVRIFDVPPGPLQ